MRRRLAVLTTALAIGGGGLAAIPEATPIAVAKSCHYGRVQGQRKHLCRGQYCRHTAAANRDYRRYGFYCGKRDRRGRYHLQ